MAEKAKIKSVPAKRPRLSEAMAILELLGFSDRQRNEVAANTLLALVGMGPRSKWSQAGSPLIHFNGERYLGPYPDALPGAGL